MALFNCRRADLTRYTALQPLRCMIGGVGEERELFVSAVPDADADATMVPELMPAVDNRLGRLLLPMETSEHFIELLTLHRDVPALLVYDAQGRVHQIVCDGCLFLLLMKMWDAPALFTATVQIDAVVHAENRLASRDPAIDVPLRLPPNAPPEFRAWQAQGLYDVTYDQFGRVFAVQRDGTDIKLAALWETRFDAPHQQ